LKRLQEEMEESEWCHKDKLKINMDVGYFRLESHSVGLIFVIRIQNDGEQIKGSGDRMKLRS
jgi:hypothetical protein